MTNTQMILVLASIWLAPHAPNWLGLLYGSGLLIGAAVIGLGLFK